MPMKRALLALAVVSCGPAAAPPQQPAEPRELRTVLVPRAIGHTIEEDSRRLFEITVDGKHILERTGQKTRGRVMAVDGELVTQIATTYLEYVFDVKHGDEVRPVPPLAGRTYIVTRTGEGLRVEREGGEALTEYEQAAVMQDHKSLGRPGGSEVLFASRAWRVGEEVSLDDAQREVFSREATRGSLTLKLVELTPSAARFEMSGRQTFRDEITSTIRGQVTLDPRTGRIVARSGTSQLTGTWTGRAEESATWRESPPVR